MHGVVRTYTVLSRRGVDDEAGRTSARPSGRCGKRVSRGAAEQNQKANRTRRALVRAQRKVHLLLLLTSPTTSACRPNLRIRPIGYQKPPKKTAILPRSKTRRRISPRTDRNAPLIRFPAPSDERPAKTLLIPIPEVLKSSRQITHTRGKKLIWRKFLLVVGCSGLLACGSGGGDPGASPVGSVGGGAGPGGPFAQVDLTGVPRALPPTMGALEAI